MGLAISESVMDRDNTYTIEEVLTIAEDNGYITSGHTLTKMNVKELNAFVRL